MSVIVAYQTSPKSVLDVGHCGGQSLEFGASLLALDELRLSSGLSSWMTHLKLVKDMVEAQSSGFTSRAHHWDNLGNLSWRACRTSHAPFLVLVVNQFPAGQPSYAGGLASRS
jgi:hypothetical protein